jgi:hypothetical protein
MVAIPQRYLGASVSAGQLTINNLAGGTALKIRNTGTSGRIMDVDVSNPPLYAEEQSLFYIKYATNQPGYTGFLENLLTIDNRNNWVSRLRIFNIKMSGSYPSIYATYIGSLDATYTATTPSQYTHLYANIGSVPAGTAPLTIVLADITNSDSGGTYVGSLNENIIYYRRWWNIANMLSQSVGITIENYMSANEAPAAMMGYTYTLRLFGTANLTCGYASAFNAVFQSNSGNTLTGDFHAFHHYAQNVGTITASINSFISTNTGRSLVSVVNIRGLALEWVLTAITTVSGYIAGADMNINATAKAFTIYGVRINMDGTIGSGGIWRGYYLDATGITCGSGQTFYGLHFDFTGIGTGGTILGAYFQGCSIVVTGNGQYIQAPVMTTGNRPASPAVGMIIFDSTVGKHMGWDGANWQAFW